MNAGPLPWRMVRRCWPLFGGVWGAWLVVRRLLGVSMHGDTFGGLAYWMFGLFFAVIFFMAGAAIAALVGYLIDGLMRRGGAGVAPGVTVATLVNVLAIWQVGAIVQEHSAGLRMPAAAGSTPGSFRQPPPRTDREMRATTCREPRPADARQAALWDAECR